MKKIKIPFKYIKDIETATKLLKEGGCKSVYLFGSLVTGKTRKNSDIDIGVRGLPPKKFFRTYSQLENSLSSRVDLVDFDENKDLYSLLNSLGEVVRLG